MKRIDIPLIKIHETFGYIPHPISFENNPERLDILATLINENMSDIIAVDIGIKDGKLFTPIDEEEVQAKGYHAEDIHFVAYIDYLHE